MNDLQPRRHRGLWLIVAGVLGLSASAVALSIACNRDKPASTPPPVAEQSVTDISGAVHHFCGDCHAYPPPDSFPRSAWKHEVEQGYMFFQQSVRRLKPPPIEQVVKYYEERAPLEFPQPTYNRATTPLNLSFKQIKCPVHPDSPNPAISNVNLVHLFDQDRLDLLACDMRSGQVMVMRPYESAPHWEVLAKLSHPAHAEVVDLDRDGIPDILVADLGSFEPTDERRGRVVWLRGNPDRKTFTPITLLEKVGRVADVQAGDFRKTGQLDLVVAVFGWRSTGEVYFLENHTKDWSKPVFVPRVLDERHGAIHVPVGDIDGDGNLDFVALISQEHESVVAFLGDGKGGFRKEVIYTGPHPAYGSSGIQLVDMNGDKKLDVLYTNGDVLDKPFLLKPYHSIQWLENTGSFPFKHHPITPMYGVHRAVAADFKKNGKMDIVAVSFLPVEGFPQRKELNPDAVIYLEQTESGEFVRHALEKGNCDYVSCVAGDIFGTGRIDLAIGNYTSTKTEQAVTIWKNLGSGKK